MYENHFFLWATIVAITISIIIFNMNLFISIMLQLSEAQILKRKISVVSEYKLIFKEKGVRVFDIICILFAWPALILACLMSLIIRVLSIKVVKENNIFFKDESQ